MNTTVPLPILLALTTVVPALWRDAGGRWQGVIQDGVGSVPPALLQLTTTWQQRVTPPPITNQ